MAISFSLVLLLVLLLRFCGCYSCSFSSTLLLLVLPTSFPFIFSMIKQLIVAGSMEEPTPLMLGLDISPEEEEIAEANKATIEELGSGECPSLQNDNPDGSISDEKSENLCCNQLETSDCSVSEDEASSEINAGSEGSISDDESLIEIMLENKPNAAFQQELNGGFLSEFLPEFSPELLFEKHGLMELLSEINDEDNMIEIDIAMGSIKCSRFEIQA